MKPAPINLISSGVEPIDELLGGLARGQLYLVHGESSGKALFGVKFLIEGLKRGEAGALVINYSPEDAIRRFARLGYDCRDDVLNARLVILECAGDISSRVGKLREIGPMLSELKWLMGDTQPSRLVFDSIAHLLGGENGQLASRVREFILWAERFGSTSLLISNGHSGDLIGFLRPHVNQSFKFEVKEVGERAVRFISFEKSKDIPEQAVEVDPSRGIFLLDRSKTGGRLGQGQNSESKETPGRPDMASQTDASQTDERSELRVEKGTDSVTGESIADNDLSTPPAQSKEADLAGAGFGLVEPGFEPTGRQGGQPPHYEIALQDEPEALADLFDSLLFDGDAPAAAHSNGSNGDGAPAQLHKPPSDPLIDNLVFHASNESRFQVPEARALAMDQILSTPGPVSTALDGPAHAAQASDVSHSAPSPIRNRENKREMESEPETSVPGFDPKSLNILIIDGDPASMEVLGRALSEYTVEAAPDGVSGLLKLISFKADLIIFDVDGPVVDGFTLLAQIRSTLPTPIIALSSSHLRSTDRIQSAYLGADYYLTKPFSIIELRQKVRQLLARHRGIREWITAPAAAPVNLAEDRRAAAYCAQDLLEVGSAARPKQAQAPLQTERKPDQGREGVESRRSGDRRGNSGDADGEQFIAYRDFTKLVEEKVNAAMVRGTAFSIVGCQLPNMTARGGDTATKLFGLIQSLVRSCDCISLNEKRDFVVLLSDADTAGGKAFINRLTTRVKTVMNQEPSIWMRSFPDLED